jgi:hypothetical protein
MVVAYHYTNLEAIRSMKTGDIYGKRGLLPILRFVRLGRTKGLPDTAHDGVIEGLLEPAPISWRRSVRFPDLWSYLFHDICRRHYVALLSFELKPTDAAFVVDRTHVEQELYREFYGFGKSTLETATSAYRRYFESRIPIFDYKGDYELPQLAIWSPISFNRHRLEWVKFSDDVWDHVKENTWYAPESAETISFSTLERHILCVTRASREDIYRSDRNLLYALHHYRTSKGLSFLSPTPFEIDERQERERRLDEKLLQSIA